MIRSLWVALIGPPVTAVLAAQIVLADLLGLKRALRRYCYRNPRWSARAFLWAAGVDVRIEGEDRLAGEGPRVLVANHESWFDVVRALWTSAARVSLRDQEGARESPHLGARVAQLSAYLGGPSEPPSLPSSRSSGARAMSDGRGRSSHGRVSRGHPRSKDGSLLPFKKGAFVLALQLGAPVIPVAVIGGRQIMSKGDWRIRSGPLRVVFGDPIPIAGLGHGDRDELARRSRTAIAELRGGEGPVAPPLR